MVARIEEHGRPALHPLHAVLLAATLPLVLGALLCDIAYAQSYQIQWANFASWLIAGALLLGAVALAWAIVGLFRGHRRGHPLLYALLVLATWVLGFINALVHARDAWAAMPMGLVLSIIVAALACAATAVGFSGYRTGGRP